jgi:hypothetical protein
MWHVQHRWQLLTDCPELMLGFQFPNSRPTGSYCGRFRARTHTTWHSHVRAQCKPFAFAVTSFSDGKLAALVTNPVGETKEKLGLLPLDFHHPYVCWISSGPASHKATSVGWATSRSCSSVTVLASCTPFVRDGQTDNLWLQHLDGSPGKQLTDFKFEFIRDFDYSYDGKQLAIIRGHREADVVLIRDLGK